MPTPIDVGTSVHVRVPASSANLGPGFDTFGLAVGLYDDIKVTVTDSGLDISVEGEGSGSIPLDESHLLVKVLYSTLEDAGYAAPGLKVECTNRIPQSRGLGSSAATIVAGVAAANSLAGGILSTEQMIQIASRWEGHPDNASAALLGGAVVSWTEYPTDPSIPPYYHAVNIPVDPRIKATAFIPDSEASTEAVRKVLPETVSHQDASFNVARAALMTTVLTGQPELLWEATRDKLHQEYRAQALPVTARWVNLLRDAGYAAFLSGAGSTVMVLSVQDVDESFVKQACDEGLRVLPLEIAQSVQTDTATSAQ